MKGAGVRRNLICLAAVAAVLLVSLLPARYSNQVYAYLPFFTILTLVLLSVAGTLLVRRRIRFSSDCQNVECRRGEAVPMSLQVRNDSILACPKARAYLYVSGLLDGGEAVTPTTFPLAGKNTSDFSFDIKMTHIGEYRAGLRAMEIYDFLGLFRFTVPGRKDLTVTVLPREVMSQELELNDRMLTESHNQRKSVISDGFDYNGVREYAMGDSMKRIHWKLSAHTRDYMTKITETSLRNDLSVVLDLSAPERDGETLACLYDALVETALSFTRQAAAMDTEYSLLFPGRDDEIQRIIPKGQEDERELIRRLAVISGTKRPGRPDGVLMLRAERRTSGGSSNLILCTADINEELLQELVAVKQQKRNPILCYILPHETDRKGREEATRPLRILDDYGISYQVILAESARTGG